MIKYSCQYNDEYHPFSNIKYKKKCLKNRQLTINYFIHCLISFNFVYYRVFINKYFIEIFSNIPQKSDLQLIENDDKHCKIEHVCSSQTCQMTNLVFHYGKYYIFHTRVKLLKH